MRKIVQDRANQATRQGAEFTNEQGSGATGPRVIAVTSGKGGVGKTNIVAGLALALTNIGKKVLILDADLGLANIDIIFGIHPKHNIGHVLSGEKTLPEIIVTGPGGVRIIPAGSGFVSLTHLTNGQKLSLLSEFEALDNDFDFLIIDTGAGISDNVTYFNLAADECMIVATPEPTSVTDAYAMIKVMANEHGEKYFKLLMNMVKDEDEAKAVFLSLSQAADQFLNGVVLEYIGYILQDEKVPAAVCSQKTFVELYPNTAASRNIRNIAGAVLERTRRFDTNGNIKFFVKRYMDYRG
ncbi:MAG: MinD/ParA family protein [Deltaproteobacteria bacterium]|nr:MinD/ParA family protein [Deltaproteobacteria bacterium]